jgi:hypothetical protein
LTFSESGASPGTDRAQTHPEHQDPGLRGRTYAIPFTQVFAGAVELCSQGLRGWTTVRADEDLGLLQAEAETFLFKNIDDVEIRLSLDENALTRVDMVSSSRDGKSNRSRNEKRIRKFFKELDRKTGAGPGTILDPTIPLTLSAFILMGLVGGCGPVEEAAPEIEVTAQDSLDAVRNFQARSYERHIVFLTFQGDSTLVVPMFFRTDTKPEGVEREIKGWLARSYTWDPFFSEEWTDPPNTTPWKIIPRGPVRLVVGQGDALETILFQEGGRNLEMNLGELLVEWSGQQAQTFRVHEASIVLSDRTVEGHLLDMSRAWAEGDRPSGDWGILLSGDSLQAVMEDLDPASAATGGRFTFRARVSFLDRQWRDVRFMWSEVRAFEEARRDVPMGWEIETDEGDLTGTLTSTASFLAVAEGEGEGPLLPVDGLFQVSGTLILDGGEYPVRGFISHQQR